MQPTDCHARYDAHELTRCCPPESVNKFAAALAGTKVDLNPSQVDAAFFAFRSPFSNGTLLADEVGLGKTIDCEWGNADCSLRVENLPQKSPEPGQQDLRLD